MIKNILMGVCVLLAAAVLPVAASADQSIGYQRYFKDGIEALKNHDDQKALRCFKIAQIYDPNDIDLKQNLADLDQRGVVLNSASSLLPPEESIGYQYYLTEGIRAYRNHDDRKAIRYFKIAIIFYSDSIEARHYLDLLSQGQEYSSVQELPQSIVPAQTNTSSVQAPPEFTSQTAVSAPAEHAITQEQPRVVQPQLVPTPNGNVGGNAFQAVQPAQQVQSAAALPVAATYIPSSDVSKHPTVLSLSALTNNGLVKPKLSIEFHSTIFLEGKNIQRFLVVDEGYLGIKIVGPDRLEVDALKIGSTFLHIWDDSGRSTLYIEVVFPKNISSGSAQANEGIVHSQPFVFTYGNDWSTYYSGKNISDLKRQSYDFNQTLGVTGETPYGYFDASGSYSDFNAISQFDTYTMGLSQIPLDGTSNFNVRAFDALRYLSPLTMPGTRLRGAFADVDLFDDNLGVSVSEGQEQQPLGFITMGESQFSNSYIDALKLTLFPKSITDQYSFNFATAYGSDRLPYLTNHVYSIEGQHKFNDFLTLNAEGATDSSHDSELTSLQWQRGVFKTGLNFRNVDKDYSTISTLPSYQGETGASWTTDTEFDNISENTFAETYRDRLFGNPDNPSALDYDANGHLRANITPDLWSDSDFNYVDTAGDLSPRHSIEFNERLSRSFGIWDAMKGVVFSGVGYQDSHSSDTTDIDADSSDYNREDFITGVQLPLTNRLSSFANYEYDWLNQPETDINTNPSIINAGLEYQRQINSKFSVTSQVTYRDELGVKADNNSFLSGERSVILSAGFSYNPTSDMSIFADADASKIVSHIDNPSYDDFEVHVGMRITFGGATYWDPLGTVSGIVFKDINGDGKYAPGDKGVPGVKIKVGDKVATTDKDGRYRIQVRAKGVQVYPLADTVPGGLLYSTPQALNVQIKQGHTVKADFGFISQTGIYGIVFVDNAGTGVPNENDKFVGKVKVILDGKITQKSDSHGAFYFRKVTPGQHIMSIDINSLELNMVPRLKLENKIDVIEGTNYMFNIPVQIKLAEGGQI